VSDKCLACLCEMTSGCNASARVCEGDECGVFHITRPYWIDAGKPVLPGDSPDDAQGNEHTSPSPVSLAHNVKTIYARERKRLSLLYEAVSEARRCLLSAFFLNMLRKDGHLTAVQSNV